MIRIKKPLSVVIAFTMILYTAGISYTSMSFVSTEETINSVVIGYNRNNNSNSIPTANQNKSGNTNTSLVKADTSKDDNKPVGASHKEEAAGYVMNNNTDTEINTKSIVLRYMNNISESAAPAISNTDSSEAGTKQNEAVKQNDVAENKTIVSPKPYFITVDYKGENPISSETEWYHIFNETEFLITAHYDNGTTKPLSLSDVKLSCPMITSYENSTGEGYTVYVSYTEEGIILTDSFNIKVDLKSLPEKNRVLFDANKGYFNNNRSSLLNMATFKNEDGFNCVVKGLYEEPQYGAKMFLGWYSTPDFQSGTEVFVTPIYSEKPDENIIVYTDSEGNTLQFDDDITLYAKWSEKGRLISTGSCEETSSYRLYDNGLLYIDGKGEVNKLLDYLPSDKNGLVKKIIISEEIALKDVYEFLEKKSIGVYTVDKTNDRIYYNGIGE